MTTQHPETGPQIDAEALEPDDMADDNGDVCDDAQAEDEVANALATLSSAAEAQQAEVVHDVPPADDEPRDDGDEVQRLRRESARRRLRLQEAEGKLQAAGEENTRLNELVSNLLRENVERAVADKLIEAQDIWRIIPDIVAVLNDDGTGVDPVKVSAAIADVPKHWLKPPSEIWHGDQGLASGATGRAPAPRAASWATAIGPNLE